ncbi:hypothetical protein D3C80_1338030 [compost metagenome]
MLRCNINILAPVFRLQMRSVHYRQLTQPAAHGHHCVHRLEGQAGELLIIVVKDVCLLPRPPLPVQVLDIANKGTVGIRGYHFRFQQHAFLYQSAEQSGFTAV